MFHKEFARVITNEDIPEADDIFDPEEFDNYVNMELALDRHENGPEFARVNKRLKDKDVRPVIIVAENQILDCRGDSCNGGEAHACSNKMRARERKKE